MKNIGIGRNLLTGFAAALLLTSCGGSTSLPRQNAVQQPDPAAAELRADFLPALESLPQSAGLDMRSASDADNSLLEHAPVAQSAGGSAVWSAGSLSLIPPAEGEMAWAIFELYEFPLNGSIFPKTITSSPQSGFYLGFADFEGARWKLRRAQIAPLSFDPLKDWISPGGSVYVAVIAFDNPATITSLLLQTSDALLNAGLDEREDNDQNTAANPLPTAPFSDWSGSIGPDSYDGDKVDFLSFTAGEAEVAEISLIYDETLATVELALLKPGTQTLLVEDAEGNPGERSIAAGLKAGTYVLRVEAPSGSSAYSVSIDLSPGQVDELEDNDTQAQANPIAADSESSVRGDIGEGGYDGDDVDYFVIDAEKGEQLTAELTYDSSRVAALLSFRNATGQPIAQSEDGNPGARSLSIGLHEGLNYVLVEADSGGADYVLNFTRTPGNHDESENNDNFAQANDLGSLPLSDFSGSVGEAGYDGDERDYFVLATGEGELLTLTLSYPPAEGNMKLVFINPDQSAAYSDQGGNPGLRSFSWGARAGNSYVLVESLSGAADYELSISSSFPGYDEEEPNDNTSGAQVLPALPFGDFKGSIGQFGYDGDNSDVFSFNATEGETFSFQLSYEDLDGNVFLELLNSNGGRIYIDNAGNSGERSFNWGLKAGSYYVKISGNNDPVDYLLSMSSVQPEYDEMEDNDDRINAKPLGSIPVSDFSGHVGQFGYNGDLNDYHFFNLAATTALEFDLTYEPLTGDLCFYLLNAAGQIIEQDTEENPGTRLVVSELEPGTYYLRVQARSGQSVYSIEGDQDVLP